ncbi:MAG: hypothetical protein QOD42_2845 [Sphingomonadales bacterium]|jgi:hypothetical protein|nr:hypothetical protein [Sphingomonadales bacterium]
MSPVTRDIVTEIFEWQGVTIEIGYEAEWLGCRVTAHLELHVRHPEGAVLPVTDTGYRSHFLPQGAVEDAGGPTAYVTAWLDVTARSKPWREIDFARRQLPLF